MEISLRPVCMEDAELLLNWANEKEVRKNSFHQETIGYEEHMAWLGDRLQDKNSRLFIAGSQNGPVGQVRMDIEEDGTAWIDYAVDQRYRGLGYGTALILAAEREAGKDCEADGDQRARILCLAAQVKIENQASARVFEKCGFLKTAEREGFMEYKKELNQKTTGRRLLICTHKSWNISNAKAFLQNNKDKYEGKIFTEKTELTKENVDRYQPEYIFFPHWSYIIPAEIYENYACIVFHMTDLPYGRGGSPLQNLIVRGAQRTKISAIRVEAGLDTGDIYCKEDLDLQGTADEILGRTSGIIFDRMIPRILEENLIPVKQEGEIVSFKRRRPEDGVLHPDMDPKTLYDHIRMLDGEGYPNAYIPIGNYEIRFTEGCLQDGKLTARAEFVLKENNEKS